LEAVLPEMTVKGKGNLNLAHFHHGEACAVGKRKALVRVPLENGPGPLLDAFIDLNEDDIALLDLVTETDGGPVAYSGAQQRVGLVEYVVGGDQKGAVGTQFFGNLRRRLMLLTIGRVEQGMEGAGVDENLASQRRFPFP
jgi:hypothetical protein